MQVKGLRSYFRTNWLPKALLMGMSEDQFWESNPRKMKPYTEAFKQRRMLKDSDDWKLGLYIRSAIASAFEKKCKYPEKPYLEEVEDNEYIDASDWTEEQKEEYRQKLFGYLGDLQKTHEQAEAKKKELVGG